MTVFSNISKKFSEIRRERRKKRMKRKREKAERVTKKIMSDAIEAIKRIDKALRRMGWSRQRRKNFWKTVIKSEKGRDKLMNLMNEIRQD